MLRLVFLGLAVAHSLARPVPTLAASLSERVHDVFVGLLDVAQPDATGKVDVALRCVDDVVRAWVRVVAVNNTFPRFDALDFTFDGVSVSFPVISVTDHMWEGGFTWFTKLAPGFPAHVAVGIRGWPEVFLFPTALCIASDPGRPHTRVMNVNIESRTLAWRHGDTHHDKMVRLLEAHYTHSHCSLGVSLYEIECDAAFRDLLLVSSPLMANLVQSGNVSVIVDRTDAFADTTQVVKQNIALLRHWRHNVSLFLFDPDEWVIFPTHSDRALLEEVMLNTDEHNSVPRPSAFCTSCKEQNTTDVEALHSKSTNATFFIDWSGWISSIGYRKSIVFPDAVHSAVVHGAGTRLYTSRLTCPAGCWKIWFPNTPLGDHFRGRTTPMHDVKFSVEGKNSNFYVAHFVNAFNQRHSAVPYGDLVEALGTDASSQLKCEM